jgi:hypothetical protein
VNYAVDGQDASGLRLGDVEVAHPPKIDRDLADLLEAGVPVFYVSEDARDRGIDKARLIDGVKAVGRDELPALLGTFEQVWHW